MSDYSYTTGLPLLTVENVSVIYDRPILRDLSLVIRNIKRVGINQGQVHGLLAPSGMGKTQLFRTIAGLQKPHVGRVMLGDDDPETPDWEVEAGMVGVVAQDYPLFSHIIVIDNLMVAARLKVENKKEARAICMKYLTDFKLEDAANKYPHEISGGMRQRVAIIQQVISCGHLLLMDEPFSGLDPLRKEDVQNLILNISTAHELNTIILTTHDIHAAIQVCDTITLLGRERNGDGHIIQGAKVAASYNLVERGLAWRPNITDMIQFRDLEREIVNKFHEL